MSKKFSLRNKKNWSKLRAGQTLFEVNAYGVMDPINLRVNSMVFAGLITVKGDEMFNCFGTTRQRFIEDAIRSGKFVTTSRRKAESYVKLLQTTGYPEAVVKHNAWVHEDLYNDQIWENMHNEYY